MSQAGEQTNPPSGGGEEETTPLSALAPDAALQEESLALGPTHVSASPAFQCLDQLFSTGKISGTKAAKLKASFSLLHDTLKSLTEEKLCLEKEYESQPKPVELEKRAKALKDSSEELRKEVSQRRQEIHSLLEDMEARHKLMTREQRELDHKKDSIVNNQAELAQLLSVPGQLGKEIERINRKKMEVEKSKAALDEQLSEVAALQKMTEARCRSLEEEKREVRRQVEGRRAHLEAAEREHSMLQKEQEMTKEKEVIMMGQ
uniref:Uncharacterized protein n=1 Tax=Oncorhynchus tshawytscha TaxID=74940 RepID=A0AAZ3RNP7_ONCTS